MAAKPTKLQRKGPASIYITFMVAQPDGSLKAEGEAQFDFDTTRVGRHVMQNVIQVAAGMVTTLKAFGKN